MKTTSVKIGCFNYVIEYIKNLCDERDKLDGRINHELAVMQIEDDMSEQAKAQSIIHEALHSVFTQIGRPELNKRDDLIDALAYSLFQVIRDNSDLIAEIAATK